MFFGVSVQSDTLSSPNYVLSELSWLSAPEAKVESIIWETPKGSIDFSPVRNGLCIKYAPRNLEVARSLPVMKGFQNRNSQLLAARDLLLHKRWNPGLSKTHFYLLF